MAVLNFYSDSIFVKDWWNKEYTNGNPPQQLDFFCCPHCGHRECCYGLSEEIFLPINNGKKNEYDVKLKVENKKIKVIVVATCKNCKREISLLPIPQDERLKHKIAVVFCQLDNWIKEVYGQYSHLFYKNKQLMIITPHGIKMSVWCHKNPKKVKKFIRLLYQQVIAKRWRVVQQEIQRSELVLD